MRSLLAGAALALAFAAIASPTVPVAFVADLKGSATIGGRYPLTFLAELEAGTPLHLEPDASVAVTYAGSGTEYALAGPGEFVVLRNEVKAEKGAAPTRRSVMPLPERAVVASTSRAATASVRMRGLAAPVAAPVDAGRARLEYPVETRVATLQPRLRWRGDPAATVSLVDASGREVWKGKGAAEAGSAQPAVKLSPATRYTWTVMTPKGPIGEAGFETLPAESLAKVAQSGTRARTFPDRVLHALLLEDIGAHQDARALWGQLASERPDLPELAALAR